MADEPSQGTQDFRVLVRLLALSLIQGMNQTEAIGLLSRSGMQRTEIAAVCGTSPNVVSVRLAEAKKKKK